MQVKKDNSRKDLVFSSIRNNLKNTNSTLQGMGWHWPLARISRPGRSDGYIYPTRIRVHDMCAPHRIILFYFCKIFFDRRGEVLRFRAFDLRPGGVPVKTLDKFFGLNLYLRSNVFPGNSGDEYTGRVADSFARTLRVLCSGVTDI